jgi:hypothetical protein
VSYPFPEGKHENPKKIQRVRGGEMTTKEKIIFWFGIFFGAASATLLAVAFVVAR